LVAGRKRVPSPATGRTALRIILGIDRLLPETAETCYTFRNGFDR
jgi:hypothetical protein